jgi:hypothetical protein
MPDDDLDLDSIEEIKFDGSARIDDDDEDAEDDMDDVREIYTELKGNKSKLTSDDVRDWSDIQDMISNGELTLAHLNKVLTEVSSDGKLDLSQFREVVDLVQDYLDGIDSFASDDEEEADDDEVVEEVKKPMKSPSLSDETAPIDDENEDFEVIIQELYDDLRGADSKLSIDKLKQWEDVKDLLDSQALTTIELEEAISASGAKKGVMEFRQFFKFVEILDSLALAEDTRDHVEGEDLVLRGKGFGSTETNDVEKELQDFASELYDELRGKSVKLSVGVLKEWEDIQEMLADGTLTEAALDAAIAQVGIKKDLTFEQFSELINILDEIVEENESGESGEVVSAEEEREIIDDLFNELRGKKDTLSVAALKEWDDVKELIQDGVLSTDDVDAIVKESGIKKTVDSEQFYNFVKLIDKKSGEEDLEDADVDVSALGDLDSVDGLHDEAFAEVSKELYDELRGKAEKVTVAALKKWKDVTDMFADGTLTEAALDAAIAQVGAKKSLTFDQFCELIRVVDDLIGTADAAADDTTEEEEEGEEEELSEEEQREIISELFDEIRGNKNTIPASSLKEWSDVKQLVEDQVLSVDDVDAIIKEVGIKKTVNAEQFYEFVQLIDDRAAAAEGFTADAIESVEYVDEEVNEDFDVAARELFDELRGDSATISATKLKAWSDVKQMVADGLLTDAALDQAIAQVSSKKSLNYEQFCRLIDILDELLPVPESLSEGVDASDESFELVAKEIFDQLKDKNSNRVSLASLRQWEDVRDLMDSKVLTATDLDHVIKSINIQKNGANFDEFLKFMEILDDFYVYGPTFDVENDASTNEVENEEVDVLPSNKGFGGAESTDDFEAGVDDEVLLNDIFNELKGKNDKVSVTSFMQWEDIKDMVKNGVVQESEVKETIKKAVGGAKVTELSLEQFISVVSAIDEIAGEMDEDSDDDILDINSSDLSGDVTDEEMRDFTKDLFNSMKSANKDSVPVKAFLAWGSLQDMLKDGVIDMDTVKILMEEAGVKNTKTGELTYEQFHEIVRMVDEAAAAYTDIDDEAEGEEAPSPEQIDELTRETFNELKTPKSEKVTLASFKKWPVIAELLESKELSAADIKAAMKHAGVSGNDLNYDQFVDAIEYIEDLLGVTEDEDEEVEEAPVESKKGFDKSVNIQANAKGEVLNEADELAGELYNELKGKKRSLSVKAFKEWDDMQELLDSGMLKHSTLEKAIVKVGAHESGEITLKQFNKLMDIIKESVDSASLSKAFAEAEDETQTERSLTSSKKSQVLSLGSANDDDDDLLEDGDEPEEITDEDAAREIFDELKNNNKKSTLSLVSVLRWNDIQELLESGALTKDNLAKAIENCGIVSADDELTFEMFFDLVQIIDEYVDQEKIPLDKSENVVFEKRVQVNDQDDVDRVMDLVDDLLEYQQKDGDRNPLKVSYIKGKQVSEGPAALSKMQDDLLDDEDDDDEDDAIDEYDDDGEVLEMFDELSKGKDYITEKALRKWDELKELVDADLVSKSTIESYINKLNIKNGKVTLDDFKYFMSMLDRVLVDDNGNILGLEDEDKAFKLGDDEDANEE